MATSASKRRAAAAARNAPPQNRYDAAGMGRRVARWNPPASGPQRAVEGAARMLQRSRDASRNDWAAESSIGKWQSALVGTGIQPRWKNKEIRAIWDVWGRQADADGALDIYGLQALMTRSWLEAGEVFVRRRPRAASVPLEVPLQVQLIESEFCPVFDADVWPGLPAEHRIQQGIERNKFGRRIAYWLYKDHPGDKSLTPSPDQLVRVPASDVAHVFEPKRPGQLRGVTPLAAVLLRLRSILDYEDAVLERQKIANLFTMFITRSLPPEWADVDYDKDTGLPKFYDANGTPLVGLEPGISQELRPGESVTFANPPEAGTTFSDYLRSTQLGVAAGQHLPYEFMSGDIKDISDRTLRIVVQEFRRFAQQRQWLTLIPQGCQRIVEWFADAAVLAGRLPLSALAEARAPEWSPHAWDYIHPVQDAQGKKLLLEMGVTSRTALIAERGDDPEKVLQQREEDAAAEKAAGLAPEPVAPSKPAPAASVVPVAQARAPEPPAPSALETTFAGLASLLARQQESNAALMAAFTGIAQALAERGTTVSVAAPNVSVAPAAVTVQNTVEPTPVQVTVEPAAVAVTNNVEPTPVVVQNSVEPTPVTIENNVAVELPDRRIESEITRDARGDIVNVVQTETTIQ